MTKVRIVFILITPLLFISCQRTGYETIRQLGYQECLKNSLRPQQECRYAPDYDEYQRLRKTRYPENTGN